MYLRVFVVDNLIQSSFILIKFCFNLYFLMNPLDKIFCKCYFQEREIFSSVWLYYENFSRKYFHVFGNLLIMLFSTTTTQQENPQNTNTHTTTQKKKKNQRSKRENKKSKSQTNFTTKISVCILLRNRNLLKTSTLFIQIWSN